MIFPGPQRTDVGRLILVVLLGRGFYELVKWTWRRWHRRWRVRAAKRRLASLLEIPHAHPMDRAIRTRRVLGYLRKVDPFVFEEMILTAFARLGHRIVRNRRYTGDGRVDGRVFFGPDLYLIQAKRYSGAINPRHVEQFASVVKREGAAGGFFVHTGRTGPKSWQAAETSRIRVVSGQKLVDLLCGPSGEK